MVLVQERLALFQMFWKALSLSEIYQNKSQKLQCSLPTLNRYHPQYGVIVIVEVLPLLSLEESSSGRSKRLENEQPNVDKSLAYTWNAL